MLNKMLGAAVVIMLLMMFSGAAEYAAPLLLLGFAVIMLLFGIGGTVKSMFTDAEDIRRNPDKYDTLENIGCDSINSEVIRGYKRKNDNEQKSQHKETP